MPKRIISEGVLDKLFSLFFKAKAENKEDKFIANIRKKDPELADAWSKWDSDMEAVLKTAREGLKAQNISTNDLDNYLKNR
jgi:hypothetical protein